jgi:signal transduction histidine kinase
VIRLGTVAQAAGAIALVTFGWVADRGFREQGEAARRVADTAAGEAAVFSASEFGAALTAIEQTVLDGRPGDDVRLETLAIPPEPAASTRGETPYSRRPRADLSRLLSSSAATANGLPEAVVARLALGRTGSIASGEADAPDVGARLLEGALPVRPEDLAYLTRALGIFDEGRVRALQERLTKAPDPETIPAAPSFRRSLAKDAQDLEGWTRIGGLRRGYEVGTASLLQRAAVSGRAHLVGPGVQTTATERTAPVAGVAGLVLAVPPDTSRELRVRALRVVLWTAVVISAVGLWGLRRALAREAAANAREKAFLAAVTHELRSPLASIRLLGETLEAGRGEPREYGALVAGESERLEGLVERVLTLARTDAAPRFGEAEPEALVRAALALLSPRADRRAVTLECRMESPLSRARWDAEGVKSALLNLVENAIVHGRHGGRVVVAAHEAKDEVRISVSDDGPGISRQERRSVFERFKRGRSESPGSGLGLYLVEQVARAHGGRVDLETEEGRGSTFTLVLPLNPPASLEGSG